MAVHLYVLRSESTGRFYVGISKFKAKRLRQHNRDQSRATAGGGPWVEVYREEHPDYATARTREKYWKSGAGRQRLRSAFGGQGSSLPA